MLFEWHSDKKLPPYFKTADSLNIHIDFHEIHLSVMPFGSSISKSKITVAWENTHAFYWNTYFDELLLPMILLTGWSLLSSLCTTLKASRNSLKSILPSLLKSMLRARSSIALLSILIPRCALKRCQVCRNSSIEIRPEHSQHTINFHHSKKYI